MLPKKTNIGILAPITWDIPPRGYGPWEKVVYNLLVGLRAKGYENLTLFATKQAQIPGVKTYALYDEPLGDGAVEDFSSRELLHISNSLRIAAQEVDILHNNLNFHPLLFSEFFPKPIVTTLHGAAIAPNAKTAFQHYQQLPYVSISNAERKILPELNYVATVYNGIDFSEFELGEKPGDYLVNVGRMHPSKGVHHAIGLAKKLGIPLQIAGLITPDTQTYFDEMIAPHLSDPLITFHNSISQKDVAKLVSRARAFVGLIDWEEPFGLAVAEAMASGTPVIGTPRGSHAEIIIPGETGILVSGVDEAAARFEEIEQIDRKKCRQMASSMFGLEAMAEGYLNVYERVLSSRQSQKNLL